MIRRLIILLLIVWCVFGESRNTTITNRGNMIEYMFGSFKPPQDICLTKEKRQEIQHQLKENIIHLNLDQKLFRADDHVLFSWPLLLNDDSNDYGYHGISGFVDNNLNYNDNLLDYNCGSRTYDTEDYNHQGTDYYLWPFEWTKVENDVVSVVAASSGIKNDKIISDSPSPILLLTDPTPSVVKSASKRLTVISAVIDASEVSDTLMYPSVPLVRVDGLPC